MQCLNSILLAEDDPSGAELTISALSELNLANRVDVVDDGEQVLEYLQRVGRFQDRPSGNPILILMDLKMPKMTGLDALRWLRGQEKFRSIPVVILTSSREESDLVEAYGLGVNAYVVKPVDFVEFIRTVKQLGVFWALVNEPPPECVNGTDR